MRIRLLASALALMLLLLCGCGSKGSDVKNTASGETEPTESSSEAETPYEAPPFQNSEFNDAEAQTQDGISVDLSQTAQGFVGVKIQDEVKYKVQILKDDSTYTYNISSDGSPSIYPLQCGDGTYTLRVMQNVEEDRYVEALRQDFDVVMEDEFQPYLRPSDYVSYSEDSECVQEAAALAAECSDVDEVISQVFTYVTEHVTYDHEKAENVESGYLPDPDETLESGKGICFDYAALAAAMLRSQGIPTKLICGYVAPDGLYHAWNMFYTEESGWVTVSYEVDANDWSRLDLTFSASGTEDDFIRNDENYTDVYYY